MKYRIASIIVLVLVLIGLYVVFDPNKETSPLDQPSSMEIGK